MPNDMQGVLSTEEQARLDVYLGMVEARFHIGGETYTLELEIEGTFRKDFMDGPRVVRIDHVYVTGCDNRIDIVAALTQPQIDGLEEHVKLENRPSFSPEDDAYDKQREGM